MIDKLLDASIRFRWGVVILTLIISAYGLSELLKLPIDAVPDITKWTTARTFIAHDHKGGSAFTKALANIGAACLFAYCD